VAEPGARAIALGLGAGLPAGALILRIVSIASAAAIVAVLTFEEPGLPLGRAVAVTIAAALTRVETGRADRDRQARAA
jgi:hypothetical protein